MRALLDFEPAFLRSRVARRVFTLFVLSAVIPVIVMVLLALGQFGGLLQQIGYRELSAATKNYGMSIVDRLGALEGALGALGTDIRGRQRSLTDVLPVSAQLHFRSVRLLHYQGIAALSEEARAHLKGGNTVITIAPDSSKGGHVVMLRLIDPRRPSLGTLVAEPDPAFLFGERDSLPYLTDICVLATRGRVLFCSSPLPDGVVEQMSGQDSANPRTSWRENSEELVASGWTLFLEGHYSAPSWTVIASRPKADLLAPLDRFWSVVLPALLVSLLFVMLLTVIQVRRHLVPLESLTAATRRIGNKDFTQPVTVCTGDEFEELAQALNAMAARLGRQFSALATWSEADRAILSDPSIDRVLETVLKRLPDVVPADVLSVTVLEDRVLGLGRTYARVAAADARILVERTELPVSDIDILLARAGGSIVCSEGVPPYLAAVARLGATSTCVLPVVLKGTLVAIIGLGYCGAPALAEDDRVHIGNVADRVAVALLAAERERQLYRQAHYDLLTGLPNRLYVEDRLAQDIAHAERDHQRLALLFIDLDRFKDVNDTLGHASGDDLLRQVSVRLQGCVRVSDTVARLGGDEFTIVLTNIVSPRGAQMVAENVIRVLSEPIVLEGRETFVSCSIGLTLYPDDGANSEELLRKADTAMYRAKQTGRGRYAFFEERMNSEALDRIALEQDLRRALARDEFVLFFQPQVDLRSGTVIGAEMLVRWAHPSRGLLPPDQFISIAENAALIESIGEHLLRKACAQHSRWRDEGLVLKRLAVNVSTRQLRQANFWELVKAALHAADMSSSSLELEITENLLLEDVPEVVANLARLEGMGVKVAIDDFGTGYSSLAYLKRLPIHVVKIDRVFMRDTPASDDAATIVKTIVAMAQSLRKEVIAEGVESLEQISFLLAIGCHQGQGFVISRPLGVEEFAAYLRTKGEPHFVQAR